MSEHSFSGGLDGVAELAVARAREGYFGEGWVDVVFRAADELADSLWTIPEEDGMRKTQTRNLLAALLMAAATPERPAR